MKNKQVQIGIAAIVIALIGFSVWVYWGSLTYSGKTKHETHIWAVIKDSRSDIIAVETANPSVWDTLVNLHLNQTEMWIGGIVEKYDNHWGFRFRPDSIIIAQITIEGAQSTLQGVSEDLNYWINIWTKETYVLSGVTEIHE